MTNPMLTCEMFDALLPEYLEGTLDAATREGAETHVQRCARCAALVRDVETITREAGVLPDLVPDRDLWSGIEARLESAVVPLASHASLASHTPRTSGTTDASHAGSSSQGPQAPQPARRAHRVTPRFSAGWLAAAALLLMAATAGVTYQVTKSQLVGGRVNVATNGQSGQTTPLVRGGTSNIRAVANSPVDSTYDHEIAELRASLDARRSELDPATVALIEQNLRVIDTAIAQSRAALAADPASQFLHDQLNIVLGQKVALLRKAALLPSHT